MVKNEWIKLFRNRIFLIFFVAVFLFFGFYLYWSLEIYEKSYGVVEEAPASYYRELVKELSSYTDVEKEELLLERRSELTELAEYLFRSTEFNMTELVYQEVWDEVARAVNYKDTLSAIVKNTDTQIKRLDRGNYGTLERQFMENRLEKTKAVYQGLSDDVTPVFYPSRGIRALVDNPITDCCCLFILLLAVFQLVTVERQNELIILSKSTVRGRGVHGVVKALTLGILCVLVTVLLMVEGILVVGSSYPFASFDLPIQSVYSYCTLRINIWQYICLYTLLKILFYLLCMAMFYFVCCMLRTVIPIFLVILSGGGLLLFLNMGISETSHLAPFKTFNPIALGQVGKLMERYQCVNIFGIAVNRLPFAAGFLCVLTILFLAAAVKVFAVLGEKNILSDRRSFYDKKRWSVSLTVHEFYKAFISQKLLFVLAVAAAAAYLQATPAEGETTLVDHLYYVYSSEVAGKYSDDILDYIQQKQEEVFASAFLPDVQEGEKMVYDAMQEAVSRMSEYAAYLSAHEDSYYINNPAFSILTGANENTNRNNIITSMLMYAFAVICYVLTLSIDYQRGENRLVHSTTKGRGHYVGGKLLIGMFISLILLGMFWLPQLVSLLRTNGADYIFAPACSLQHLEWVWGKISIFAYIFMGYAARYLSLLVLMVFSYLVERKVKSSIIAIICVCAVVEIPLAVMLL